MIDVLLRWLRDSLTSPWVAFWSLMIFASIAWYAFLVFYLGVKGGLDILRMTKALSQRPEDPPR